MIVDFQTHYTPPELMRENAPQIQLDDRGNPVYFLNPLLAELPGRLAMMDRCGIDAQVLSCGAGFDQPDIATCRLINNSMAKVGASTRAGSSASPTPPPSTPVRPRAN